MNKDEMYSQIEKHYRENADTTIKKLRTISGSKANSEDVVQEAYTRALQYWNSYDDGQSFDKWFKRIIMNCLSDKMKDERLRGTNDVDILQEDLMPAVGFDHVYLEDIRKLVDTQPVNIKNILSLYFFKQYKTIEIAQLVPESHSNIRVIIHNFRKQLKG